MTSLDFLLCCLGVSGLIVALAAAMRLLGITLRPYDTHTDRHMATKRVVSPPEAPIVDEPLARRLREFQEARFSSPIVQHALSRDPEQRSAPHRVPRLKSVPPPLPKQPVTDRGSNVVSLPTKQRKDSATKKEPDK
jgi:hypothetical protein